MVGPGVPASAETNRESVDCEASAPRPPSGAVPTRSLAASRKAGSPPNTHASLWSLRLCAIQERRRAQQVGQRVPDPVRIPGVR